MSGNKNTYLTVQLPPASIDGLAALAGHLTKMAAALPAGPSGKVPSFRAMERGVMHMTFFFAGEQLVGLNGDRLAAFHTAVVAAAALAGGPRDTELMFVGLRLFPPGKNNLIVAEYAAPGWLSLLQAEVERIAAEHSVGTSDSVRRDPAANCAAAQWVPHVTLGKIRATRATVGGVGATLVQAGAAVATPLNVGGFRPRGLNVGGFHPRQRWLDWAIPFALGSQP